MAEQFDKLCEGCLQPDFCREKGCVQPTLNMPRNVLATGKVTFNADMTEAKIEPLHSGDVRSRFNAWLDAEFYGIRLTDAEVNAMQSAFMAGASLPSSTPSSTRDSVIDECIKELNPSDLVQRDRLRDLKAALSATALPSGRQSTHWVGCGMADARHYECLKRDAGDAYGYARRLAETLHRKHFGNVENWKPLDTVLGVLMQIDNMTSGLIQASTPPEAVTTWACGWAGERCLRMGCTKQHPCSGYTPSPRVEPLDG